MSNQQIVQSRGIYHGLPVYPSSAKGLTAIITGANGISGNYMLRVLSQAPERWSKIYCLSRRPPALPEGLPKNAEHIALDFLQEPEKIAAVLKEGRVKANYVFFYSYVQTKPKEGGGLWSDAEEMCRVNGRLGFSLCFMRLWSVLGGWKSGRRRIEIGADKRPAVALLQNFCEALPLAEIKPKRIMLQTGAKNYGYLLTSSPHPPFLYPIPYSRSESNIAQHPPRPRRCSPRRMVSPREPRTKLLLPTRGLLVPLLLQPLYILHHLHAILHLRRSPRRRHEFRLPARRLRVCSQTPRSEIGIPQ